MKRFCYIFLSLWVFASCSNDDVESSDVTLEVRDYVEETIYKLFICGQPKVGQIKGYLKSSMWWMRVCWIIIIKNTGQR